MKTVVQSIVTSALAIVALVAFAYVFHKIFGDVLSVAQLQANFKTEDQKPPEISDALSGLAGGLATLIGGAAIAVFAKKDALVDDTPETTKAPPLKAIQSLGVLASTPKRPDDSGNLQLVLGSVFLAVYVGVALRGGYIWLNYSAWTPEVVTTFVGGVVGVIGPTVLALFGASQTSPSPAPAAP